MKLEDVKKFLEENKDDKEVSAYLGELSAVSAEKVEGFLDTAEGKKLLQPRLDQNFTKGLTTWKENNLDQLIEEEVKKRNPEETPEQKELAALRKQFEDEKKARNRESLKNKALTVADEKKLPKGILDYFIADDEENTMTNLSKLEEAYNESVKSAVDAKFKENGTDFNKGGNNKPAAINISELAKEASIRE
ncbi:DUF4355 domain-containing protein [Virgibacillus oceani]